MKKRIYFVWILISGYFFSSAQSFNNFNWIDFQKDTTIQLQGQLWGKEVRDRFDRLPAAYEGKKRSVGSFEKFCRNLSGFSNFRR